MKIDFSTVLLDVTQKAIKFNDSETERELLLRDVAITALTADFRPTPEDTPEVKKLKNPDGRERYLRTKLADKVFGTAEPIELKDSDCKLLKELINLAWGTLVTGRALDAMGERE